jgi:hypothetical protein
VYRWIIAKVVASPGKQIKLLEYARLDFLSASERRIYLRNRLEVEEEGEEEGVSPWAKALAWVAIVGYNLAFSFYVCLFGYGWAVVVMVLTSVIISKCEARC